MKHLHTRKTSNGSNFGWLIRQMSINQKSGRKTFRRRFVSGSVFVSPCPPECYYKAKRKLSLISGYHHFNLRDTERRGELARRLPSLWQNVFAVLMVQFCQWMVSSVLRELQHHHNNKTLNLYDDKHDKNLIQF